MAMFGTSSVLGPVIGGFFAGQEVLLGISGWRWVFLVNVPIGIAALFVVSRTLHIHPERHDVIRIDWWGAVALAVGLVPLLIVAEQGRQWGWDSARSVTAYVVGGLGLVAFVLIERRMGEAALIPLRLFRIRAAASRSRQRHRRHGDVRRHHDPAALHADRARREPDRVRVPDAADGRRDDDRLDRRRPIISRTGRIRPVPDLRLRADRGRRCRCCRSPPRTPRCWSRCRWWCSASASATACSRCC